MERLHQAPTSSRRCGSASIAWRPKISLRQLLGVWAGVCVILAAFVTSVVRQMAAVAYIRGRNIQVYYDDEVDADGRELYERIDQAGWLRAPIIRDCISDVVGAWSIDVELRDDDLAQFAELPNTRRLAFWKCGAITDEGVSRLRGLRHLAIVKIGGSKVTNRGLAHLAVLPELQDLDIGETQVTDEGIELLSRVPALKELSLGWTAVTDRGLSALSKSTCLTFLDLRHTRVTDVGVRRIASLPNLSELRLDETPVTDAVVEHLKGLRQLRFICLRRTEVTRQGLQELSEALPGARVVGDGYGQ